MLADSIGILSMLSRKEILLEKLTVFNKMRDV